MPEFSVYLQQPLLLDAAHQEALKKEIERLRQIYHQQSLKNAEAPTTDDDPAIRSSDKGLPAAAPS
jgi:cyclic AMP-dependent transcription factor ATF-4